MNKISDFSCACRNGTEKVNSTTSEFISKPIIPCGSYYSVHICFCRPRVGNELKLCGPRLDCLCRYFCNHDNSPVFFCRKARGITEKIEYNTDDIKRIHGKPNHNTHANIHCAGDRRFYVGFSIRIQTG